MTPALPGITFLPPAVTDFLLASHNLQVASLIETSQVTGTEPTVLSERLSVLLGFL